MYSIKWKIPLCLICIQLGILEGALPAEPQPQAKIDNLLENVKKGREYGGGSVSDSNSDHYQGSSGGFASSYTPYYGPSSSGGYSDSSFDSGSSSYYGPPSAYDPTRKKKPLYPTHPTYYPPGSYPSTLIECQEHMVSTAVTDAMKFGGLDNFGLIKSLVAAGTTALLAKIPIILAIKALLVKLIVIPIGLTLLVMPILVPIFMLFMPLWNRLKDAFTGGQSTSTPAPQQMIVMMPQGAGQSVNNTASGNAAKPAGRSTEYMQDIIFRVLDSDECFERLACQLGAKDSMDMYKKPVAWLLKFLQNFKTVEKNYEVKNRLKRYKEAFTFGSNQRKLAYEAWANSTHSEDEIFKMDDICSNNDRYPCNEPKLNLDSNFFARKLK